MSRTTFCAIIGDIDSSRQLGPRRAETQRRFESSLAKINDEFKSDIASRFLITLGDEFQGVLRTPALSLQVVRRLQLLMRPVSLSFGVGVGRLDTPVKPVALGMDGEAFHRAREAVTTAKSGGKGRVIFSFESPAEKMVNLLVLMADRKLARVRPTTLKVHALMVQKKNQSEVAAALKMTQQGVSRAVRSAAYREVLEIDAALNGFLDSL